MSDKILIIGKGFLGSAIFSTCQNAGIHVLGTHYNKSSPIVDITNINSIEKVANEFRPDLIINCAALTNLEQIESNPERAYAINAYGAKNIAAVSKQNKIKMIHVSTDSVFDGIKGPGLHWNPPIIDSWTVVDVVRVRPHRHDALMLTKDENIVDVTVSVQYQIEDPKK